MKSFLSQLWSRRWLRVTCWIVISLVVLAILMPAVAAWTGQRRWQGVKAALKAEGEMLDIVALLPPAVEPDRNFGAIPALQGIRQVEGDNAEEGAPGAKRAALEGLAYRVPEGGKPLPPLNEGMLLGRPVNMENLTAALRQGKAPLITGTRGEPAKELREALERTRPLLVTLAQAARERPEAEFTPALREQVLPDFLFALKMPQINAAMQAGRGLQMHGLACAVMKDSAAATGAVLALLRLTEACGREPFLIGHLVAMNEAEIALNLVWQMTEKQGGAEADLELVQQNLERLDFQEYLLRAQRGEMAAGTNAVEFLETNASERVSLLALVDGAGGNRPGAAGEVLAWLIPGGFFTHSKSGLAEMQMEYCVRPLKAGGVAAALEKGKELDTHLKAGGWQNLARPDLLLARMMVPAVQSVLARTALMEARRRQAILACALERHFLKSQKYPQTLSELVPAFLPKVALDPMDGKTMRYRTTEAGRYEIWSVAFDRKDDGGKVPGAEPAGTKVRRQSDVAYQGDWVWRYEAEEAP